MLTLDVCIQIARLHDWGVRKVEIARQLGIHRSDRPRGIPRLVTAGARSRESGPLRAGRLGTSYRECESGSHCGLELDWGQFPEATSIITRDAGLPWASVS
jgi:hypothetical protein